MLGQNRGLNFAAEYGRLQQERVAAFREFADDVRCVAYPGKGHLVGIEPVELASFLDRLEA